MRVLATVVSLMILALGVRAISSLPILQYPRTQNAVVTVTTTEDLVRVKDGKIEPEHLRSVHLDLADFADADFEARLLDDLPAV